MARNTSRTTTDHEEIRRWVEERGGTPSEVAATATEGDPGIIRIDFPGYSGEGKLQPIGWDDWFRKFDDSGLAFVFQETTAEGERSNFNKLVSRDTAAAKSRKRGGASTGARGGAARRGARTSGQREAARTTGKRKAPRKPPASRSGGKRAKRGAGGAKKRGRSRGQA
ncbi:MAG: hypothetical protein QM704_26325 [Anaeromyxobacteraceae bacterium]